MSHARLQVILTILLISHLWLQDTARAEESWNILFPEIEEESRLASAQLFNAASTVFEGFAAIELESYDKAEEQFSVAVSILIEGADKLRGLSAVDVAQQPVDISGLKEEELRTLANWTANRVGQPKDISALSAGKITISQLLNWAADDAERIASNIKESYGDIQSGDPERARVVIDDILWFLYVGTIASKAFN